MTRKISDLEINYDSKDRDDLSKFIKSDLRVIFKNNEENLEEALSQLNNILLFIESLQIKFESEYPSLPIDIKSKVLKDLVEILQTKNFEKRREFYLSEVKRILGQGKSNHTSVSFLVKHDLDRLFREGSYPEVSKIIHQIQVFERNHIFHYTSLSFGERYDILCETMKFLKNSGKKHKRKRKKYIEKIKLKIKKEQKTRKVVFLLPYFLNRLKKWKTIKPSYEISLIVYVLNDVIKQIEIEENILVKKFKEYKGWNYAKYQFDSTYPEELDNFIKDYLKKDGLPLMPRLVRP